MSCRVANRKQAAWAALMPVLLLGKAHALALRGPSAEISFSDLPLGRTSGAGRRIEVAMRPALTTQMVCKCQ